MNVRIKLNVADAGSFERSLTLLANTLRWVDLEYVCDSTHYLPTTITTIGQLKNFEGRYYIFDPNDKEEEFKIVQVNDKELLNKKLYIKTPITCSHPKYDEGTLCRGCYTEMLAVANQRLHIGMASAYAASDDAQQVKRIA